MNGKQVVISSCGMTACEEVITPEMAQEYLKQRIFTRKLSPTTVHQYATSMKTGKWVISPEGVSFDVKGRLVEGAHRCTACISINAPFTTIVFRNVPKAAVPVINRGKSRSLTTSMSIMDGEPFDQRATTIIVNLFEADTMNDEGGSALGMPVSSIPEENIMEFYQDYKECIDLTIDLFSDNKTKISLGPVKAAVAAAACKYTSDKARARLVKFVQILHSGETDNIDTDRAVLKLRDYLTTHSGNAGSMRGINFLRTAFAIQNFMEHNGVKMNKPAKANPFRLPHPAIEYTGFDHELLRQSRLVVSATPPPRK